MNDHRQPNDPRPNDPRPNDPRPSYPRPLALQAVERGIAELRRGAVIILRGHGRALLVQAADGVVREALARLLALSGTTPALVLTARRAQILGFAGDAVGAVRISLSGGVSAEAVQQMADPAAPPPGQLSSSPLALGRIEPGGLEAAAVALTKLAHLLPAAVVAEVPAARLGYLPEWAVSESLIVVEHQDVEEYPVAEARSLQHVADAAVPLTDAIDTRIHAFRPTDGSREHLAIVVGKPDPAAPVLVRLHSECFTGDLLNSLRCDCGDQLRGALQAMTAAGGGVIVYLAQEGRGIGLVNKLRAYSLQDRGFDTLEANEQLGYEPDERDYLPAAEILKHLGYTKVRLLTNNPDKVQALGCWDIDVVERVAHSFPANPHNRQYLLTKQQRAGHLL